MLTFAFSYLLIQAIMAFCTVVVEEDLSDRVLAVLVFLVSSFATTGVGLYLFGVLTL